MASSGSYDFLVTGTQIVTDALENIGVLAAGGTVASADQTMMLRKLNLITKQWMGKSDFAPGLKLFTRARGYLFLNTGNPVYTLGPTSTTGGTTNKFTSTYVSTTIASDEAASQTVISVTSSTGILDTNRIGIELDDGSIQWGLVAVSPAGNDITIGTALASAASAGNRVFAYATTTQGQRPLDIISASLRNIEGVDTELTPMSVEEYEQISNKSADGTPSSFYYEPNLIDGTIYLDVEPSDVTQVIRVLYWRATEDFDSISNDAAFPQEWLRPLCLQLTIDGCLPFGRQVTPEMKMLRDEALAIAKNAYPEETSLHFQPGAE
jgi:hypothetical protein